MRLRTLGLLGISPIQVNMDVRARILSRANGTRGARRPSLSPQSPSCGSSSATSSYDSMTSHDGDRLAEQEPEPLSYRYYEAEGQIRQARLVRLRGLFKSLGRFISLQRRRKRERRAHDEDREAFADDPDKFGFAVEEGDADETLLDVDLTPKFANQLCESPASTRAFSFINIDADGESETPSRQTFVSLPFFAKDDFADSTLARDAAFVLSYDFQPIACGRRSGDVFHIPVVPALQHEVPVPSVYAEHGWHEPLFDDRNFLYDAEYEAHSCSTATPIVDSEFERLLDNDGDSSPPTV